MRISCESCGAQYELDDRRVPPSGMSMKCPACLHTFEVRRSAADTVDQPAPEADLPTGLTLSHPPSPGADAELPAPAGGRRDEEVVDLLAPKRSVPVSLVHDEPPDLPAPKRAGTLPHAPAVGVPIDAPDVDDLVD